MEKIFDKIFKFVDWLRYPAMIIIILITVFIYITMEGLDKIIEMLKI